MAAVLVMVLGGFLALSLNAGHRMNTKAQLQGAFDAAALGAAVTLTGQPNGLGTAQFAAANIATQHFLDSYTRVGLTAGDATVGYWDLNAHTFNSIGSTVTIGDWSVVLDPNQNPQFLNAVKLGATTDGNGSHNGPLSVWFSAFLGGTTQMQLAASAVGVAGGPCGNRSTTLPFIISTCALVDTAGYVLCDNSSPIHVHFAGSTGRGIALTDITQPSEVISPGEEDQQIQAAAGGYQPQVNVGEVVSVGPPTDWDAAKMTDMQTPNNIICTAAEPYSGCPRLQLAVVTTGTNCGTSTNVPNSGHATIVGFVDVVILGGSVTGDTGGVSAYPPDTYDPVPYLRIWIDCNQIAPVTVPGGCANFGYRSVQTRLVQ
jgi:Flp pilus assembly protein TadG